jgi:hypothetical protein
VSALHTIAACRWRLASTAITVLTLGLLAIALRPAAAGQGLRDDALAGSIIELPVTLELGPLAALLDQHIPRWLVRRDGWERYEGFDVQYGVGRGPVQVAMFGEDLHVQIPVSYWVRVRKKLLGHLPVTGSCGVDEPPRAAWLHLAARLRWTPDWRLTARSAVFPVRYLNPCEMTVVHLDVTPLLDRYVRGKLADMAREAIDAQVPRQAGLREQVAPAWAWLNRPLLLEEGAWLLLQPYGIRLTPFFGSGTRVSTVVGLLVRPRIVLGERPAPSVSELPALQVGLPRGVGLQVPVQVALSDREAAEGLGRRLAGRSFRFGEYTLSFGEPRLTASQRRLVVTLRVGGDLEGRVILHGRPVIDADAQTVYLEAPDYELEVDDPVAQANLGLFRGAILRRLSEEARWSYREPMESAGRRLERALNRDLGAALELTAEVQELTPTAVHVDERQISIAVRVRAAARLKPR